jgi:undecaprenyl-diphosphatase
LGNWCGKSVLFDRFVNLVSGLSLVKGGLFAAILWGLWFYSRRKPRDRHRILKVVFGAVLAVVLGRLMQVMLPKRLRPIHDKSIDFELPTGVNNEILSGWSSFPGDHAVLVFALSAGFFL